MVGAFISNKNKIRGLSKAIELLPIKQFLNSEVLNHNPDPHQPQYERRTYVGIKSMDKEVQ